LKINKNQWNVILSFGSAFVFAGLVVVIEALKEIQKWKPEDTLLYGSLVMGIGFGLLIVGMCLIYKQKNNGGTN
jgi:hypothetical protein